MLHAVKNLLKQSMVAQRTYRRYVQPHLPQYEPETYILRGVKFDQCVDVGAHQVTYTILLSHNAKRVHAFEPSRHSFDVLSALNIANVTAFNAALGSARGEAEIFLPSINGEIDHALATLRPLAGHEHVKGEAQKIKVLRFDDFETKIDFDRIDFVKIDVEGFELQVLRGMERLLQLKHAALLIEIEQRHNPDYLQVFEYLGRLGYQCYFTGDGARLQPLDVAELPSLQSAERLARDDARKFRLGERKSYINNIFFLQPAHKRHYRFAPAASPDPRRADR
jgi:FkbM family methyltransferase